ncbi:MAG TPA: hypothetical protein VGQ29_15620 [Gemmatimonadales bacterium]|jgi:hypothetical protein|nr:hypothetical protein [Gemmatimonadales bacterium]
MIVVTLDLRSALSSSRSRRLATITIANDGTGEDGRGNYHVMAQRRGGRARFAGVRHFPRRSRSALELLRRALNALDENGGLP